jgi:lipoate-protein ligase A
MERLFDYEYWGYDTLPIKRNMSMEDFLLAHSELRKKATIRFWNVERDSVVLGYAEDTSAIISRDGSFDVARRITGGSHVQFDENCLAYSFTIPRDAKFLHFDEMRNYFAKCIEESLVELGIETVKTDSAASTVNVDGKVVASHAIFWGVKSALMHGLIVVDPYNVDKIASRVMLKSRVIGKKTYTEYDALKNIPALSTITKFSDVYLNKRMRREYIKKVLAKAILNKVTLGDYENKSGIAVRTEAAPPTSATRHVGQIWVEKRRPVYTKKEVDAIPGEELAGKLKGDLGYCLYIQVKDTDFSAMANNE